VQQTVTEVGATVEVHRAIINQVIGIITWTDDISADRAFDILAWRCQDTETELRRIETQFLGAITAESPLGATALDGVDRVLLTWHLRTPAVRR